MTSKMIGFTAQVTNSSSVLDTNLPRLFSSVQRRKIVSCPCLFAFRSLKYSSYLNSSCISIKAMATQEYSESSNSSGKKYALISVSDKKDLALLGNGLQDLGYTIISTGGTSSVLESVGVSVTKVEAITGFPEMFDGRVKTLHPAIHGAILATRDQKSDMEALDKLGIGPIDIVVVNLYTSQSDIGGHAMIRAAVKAVKNNEKVLVVVDPEDYPAVLEFLRSKQDDKKFRNKLANKAKKYAIAYDSADSAEKFPSDLTIPITLESFLPYGENPHQKAALYNLNTIRGGSSTPIKHHGKDMSYNNYLDAEAAWNCVTEFSDPTCVIVKHTNPCGVASRDDILEAYRLAVKGDPVSAFGGIVAFNVEVDEVLAREIRGFRSPADGKTRMFYEIVIAPRYSEKGLAVLKGKSRDLRILEARKFEKGKPSFRQVFGAWLVQDSDDLTLKDIEFRVVSDKSPQESSLSDAKFAWLCVKHVKSNAIVIAKNKCMLGMGSGQPNRLESLRIALRKAGDEAKEAALASDAFFPFAWKDAVEEACESGIGVIAEPGGSKGDGDAIDCCNKYGVSLLFTNVRHFRH